MPEFDDSLGRVAGAALRKLLSEKHLYQSVDLDLSFVSSMVEAQHDAHQRIAASPGLRPGGRAKSPTLHEIGVSFTNLVSRADFIMVVAGGTPIQLVGAVRKPLLVELPTVKTFCSECEEVSPFNPMNEGSLNLIGQVSNQWLYLSYQCQGCKILVVRFLVRRDGSKLTLSGRDPLEALRLHKALPKLPGKYYCDATIAHHAGQTLAGLFLLRVFIERFWQTVPTVQALVAQNARATGEEQGAEYQRTLPDDFKSRFPSLRDIYGKLSAAMHAADANAELFEGSCAQIVEHFEARKLFKI